MSNSIFIWQNSLTLIILGKIQITIVILEFTGFNKVNPQKQRHKKGATTNEQPTITII